jgi:hypothetical protein
MEVRISRYLKLKIPLHYQYLIPEIVVAAVRRLGWRRDDHRCWAQHLKDRPSGFNDMAFLPETGDTVNEHR